MSKKEETMNFGHAIEAMKMGNAVERSGWNGKGMWIAIAIHNSTAGVKPFIFMRTAQGDLVPWVASQTDILSDDWKIAQDVNPIFPWYPRKPTP